MTEKLWIGVIYLKDEGGYKIVLKSLKHYRNRLKTFSHSPEIKDAAGMFASVLNQQAVKTIPKIEEMLKKIQDSLVDIKLMSELSKDISFLEKALTCYETDINKAHNTGDEYFMNLIGDMQEAKKDQEMIKIALDKIKQFSE